MLLPTHLASGLLQVSAYAYTLGMVTMQLKLPHSSVLTGVWCRVWQVGGLVECWWAVGQAPESFFSFLQPASHVAVMLS